MSKILLEKTHFGDLEGLIAVLTDEHRLAVLYDENPRAYVEFTTPESDTSYRFWWNEKGVWEVEKRQKAG